MSTADAAADIVARIQPDLVALRRHLHQIPELGLHLPLTQQAVLEALAGLDIEITTGEGLSSVVGVIRGRAPLADGEERRVVLLRGDMDALPVREEVDVAYRSRHEGRMHACGHDLHVAGLVGAARILCERVEELRSDVVLMFQPAEEGPGGAAPMIAEGLLDAAGRRVDVAYALHVVAAQYPLGTWFSRPGPLMASADHATVRVIGEGGHGSAPHRSKDPIPVACEMVLALQTRVTRAIDIFDPVVVTVGKFVAGTKDNIIPDEAVFETTIRAFSPQARAAIETEIRRTVAGIAQGHGVDVEIDFVPWYPVTVNDAAEYDFTRETIVDLFGADRYTLFPEPEAGSEDFAFVAEEVPSCYVFISAAVGDWENAPDNHSPRAAFDDSVLGDCALLLAELALRRF
ncbi:MAG TPA: amidohydrolase [Intrasporangiaceae bacterium]|nr:amidohydrolase [Intrasporangiaceae bacterium]